MPNMASFSFLYFAFLFLLNGATMTSVHTHTLTLSSWWTHTQTHTHTHTHTHTYKYRHYGFCLWAHTTRELCFRFGPTVLPNEGLFVLGSLLCHDGRQPLLSDSGSECPERITDT